MDRALEVAWAAGIIEGEGYIGIPKGPKHYKYPRVEVTQKYNDLMLERLKVLFSGNICTRHGPGSKQWAVACRKAEAVCRELLSCAQFQGPKREAAEAVLAYYREKDTRKVVVPNEDVLPPG